MRTDSIKKYLIPNIPYLFILWACLKIGTAYRLAAGADFAHKLMGLGLTIGPAFADFAPGLTPFDWLGMALICFILPAVLSWFFCEMLRKIGWIREGDLVLPQ